MDATTRALQPSDQGSLHVDPEVTPEPPNEPSALSCCCDYPEFSTSVATWLKVGSEKVVEATVGVFKRQVWMKRRGVDAAVCLSKDVSDEKLLTVALVMAGSDVYTFLGYWKSHELWIWRNQTLIAQEKNIKLKGFGAATLVESLSNDKQIVFIIATGLGIGNANVWRITVPRVIEAIPSPSAMMEHVGSLQGGKSITSVQFGRGGAHVVTYSDLLESPTIRFYKIPIDGLARGETFDLRQSHCTKISANQVADALGSEMLAEILQKKENAYREPNRCLEGLENHIDLFPRRLLFEDAYEGQVNQAGEPQGFGIQFIKAEGLDYEGQWRNGKRHGHGQLRDPASDSVFFDGNFANGERSGLGTEYKDKETFTGFFKNDVREGFGAVLFQRPSKLGGVVVASGATCHGFFRNGKLHGWARLVFPRSQFPNKCYNTDIECIGEFQTGVCLAQFWFNYSSPNSENRLDNCPIDDANESKLQARKLSLVATEKRYHGPRICWICLGQNAEGVRGCEECGFVAHSKCFSATHCPFDIEPWGEGAKVSRPEFKLIDLTTSKKLKFDVPVASRNEKHIAPSPSSVKQEALERMRLERKSESDALDDHSAIREREYTLCRQRGTETLNAHRREEVAKRRLWKEELTRLEEELSSVEEQWEDVQVRHVAAMKDMSRVFLPSLIKNTGDDELAKHETGLKQILDELLLRGVKDPSREV